MNQRDVFFFGVFGVFECVFDDVFIVMVCEQHDCLCGGLVWWDVVFDVCVGIFGVLVYDHHVDVVEVVC